MDIEELSQKIDKYHEEDIKNHEKDIRRAKKERYENMSFISLGFVVAVAGIILSTYAYIKINPHILISIGIILLIIAMIYFVVIAGIAITKSRKLE